MTAEVALLNKSAIALAADSATTVTYWDKNEPKTRYFKGANKVFNLSRRRPVGVMTYASANLQGVPWEIIIKAYREYLGPKSHDHLSGYADDFVEFIASNAAIFPADVQEKQFITLADRAAAAIVFPLIAEDGYKKETDKKKQEAFLLAGLRAHEAQMGTDTLFPGADKNDIKDATDKFLSKVTTAFEDDTYYKTIL